jgi:hypothetical protein
MRFSIHRRSPGSVTYHNPSARSRRLAVPSSPLVSECRDEMSVIIERRFTL